MSAGRLRSGVLPSYRVGRLTTPDRATIEYVMIGEGSIPLVTIPGLGDGLATVGGAARTLAWYYRKRASTFRQLMISRRQPVPAGFTARRHAEDFHWALEQLGWGRTILECNSGSGPIGQWMAMECPDLVAGLILAVTLHRVRPELREIVEHWIDLVRQGRWPEFRWSSIVYTYRPQTARKYRLLKPLLRFMSLPRDPGRAVNLFRDLLDTDTREILPRIDVPTLVIGGQDDRLVGGEVQGEMAASIPHSCLVLYPGYGHGTFEEQPDYERQVKAFAEKVWFDGERPG